MSVCMMAYTLTDNRNLKKKCFARFWREMCETAQGNNMSVSHTDDDHITDMGSLKAFIHLITRSVIFFQFVFTVPSGSGSIS